MNEPEPRPGGGGMQVANTRLRGFYNSGQSLAVRFTHTVLFVENLFTGARQASQVTGATTSIVQNGAGRRR